MVPSEPVWPCRIVIADADADVCQLLARTVRRQSYHITLVSTPTELTARLQSRQTDLLILDPLLFGWRTGLEFCKKATTSIIVITTRTSREDLAATRIAGVVDVISKPFSPRDVRVRVASACARHVFRNRPWS